MKKKIQILVMILIVAVVSTLIFSSLKNETKGNSFEDQQLQSGKSH